MSHPLRCRCGTFRGHVVPSSTAVRAVCYCNDCQAYARFLGAPGVTDEDGGTEVVACLPNDVHLTAGLDALACMSLRERGLLRWYASCCNTPVGNTPRNPHVPYVGLIHSCLEATSPSVEHSFGRRRVAVNTSSARHPVRSTPVASTAAVVRLATSALVARLSGAYRSNPFFESGTRTPIRPVRVLSDAERKQAYRRNV
jgi:hypothetical protein